MLAREAYETPQIVKPTAITVGCVSVLDGKTLLLKTLHLHVLATAHGEIKLRLNCKLPLGWLAFPVPEEAMQAAG